MGAILFVRAKSGLETEELERRLLERKPRFYEVPGLLQKIYGRDSATGAVCGIYFFKEDGSTRTSRARGAQPRGRSVRRLTGVTAFRW